MEVLGLGFSCVYVALSTSKDVDHNPIQRPNFIAEPLVNVTMSKFAPLQNDLLLRAVRGMLAKGDSPSKSSHVEQANVWNDHQSG